MLTPMDCQKHIIEMHLANLYLATCQSSYSAALDVSHSPDYNRLIGAGCCKRLIVCDTVTAMVFRLTYLSVRQDVA